MSQRIISSIGHYGFWGISATFDICEAISKIEMSSSDHIDSSEPIKIVLIQPGDIRHILSTLAKRRRNKLFKRDIHFYIIESIPEIIARDILLLEVVNDFEVPIRQRANLFLEIYGNIKVQDRTCRYIERLGKQLVNLIGHGKGWLEHVVDFSLLKYREKDEIEAVFKSYSRSNPFDIDSLWEQRLRGYYAERYDSRKSLADWDWNYAVKETASIVHHTLFKDWRLRGIAFEFGDQTYTDPNRTFMSYAPGVLKHGKDKGMKKEVKGYWSDVVVSPYFTLGIDSDTPNKYAEGLYEIMNKNTGTEQHRHHVVEVAVYNILSYLWEIETGSVYKMKKEHDIYSGLGLSDSHKKAKENNTNALTITDADATTSGNIEPSMDDSNENDTEVEKSESACCSHSHEDHECSHIHSDSPNNNLSTGKSEIATKNSNANLTPETEEVELDQLAKDLARAEMIVESFEGIKFFPLYGDPAILLNKEMFKEHFDACFISSRSAQFMNSEVSDTILKQGALIAIETGKFLLSFTKKEKSEFLKKEEELAKNRNWNLLNECPVYRRPRDELDNLTDVIFYQKPNIKRLNHLLAESTD